MVNVTVRIALVLFFMVNVAGFADGGTAKPAAEQGTRKASGETGRRKADPAETRKIVVAKVNSAEISMHALVKMMNRISATRAGGTKDEDIAAVRKEALDRLIMQELAWQKAHAEGLRAKRENVEAAIANLKENAGGEEGYRQFLEREQVTEDDLRAQVERSLTLEMIYAQEVYRKVAIPENEMKKAYEKEKGKFITTEKISVVDVFFASKDGSDSLRERAETVRTKILQDKNRDPWQVPLDGTFLVRNYKPRPGKDRELLEEARKMKKDEISRVIKAPDGFHIMKLREYSPERQMAFEEVKGYLENQLRAPAQDKRLREWEKELRKGAVVEVINVRGGK